MNCKNCKDCQNYVWLNDCYLSACQEIQCNLNDKEFFKPKKPMKELNIQQIKSAEAAGAALDSIVEKMKLDFVGKKFTIKGIRWNEPQEINTIYYRDGEMWGECGDDMCFKLAEIEWLDS